MKRIGMERNYAQIPVHTLNALKNMLVKEGGVDFSNIINDLATSSDELDITAINVALVHMGVRIDIDTATRYERGFGKMIIMREYAGYSLIRGLVKVHSYDCHFDDENLIVDCDRGVECHTFERWYGWSTDINEMLED